MTEAPSTRVTHPLSLLRLNGYPSFRLILRMDPRFHVEIVHPSRSMRPENLQRPVPIEGFVHQRPFSTSAQLQRRQAEQREHDRHDYEPTDDLRLAPPDQLTVMVERGHPEHPLPRELERPHLDDHGEHLDHEHGADDREKQLLLDEERHGTQRATERQRPRHLP